MFVATIEQRCDIKCHSLTNWRLCLSWRFTILMSGTFLRVVQYAPHLNHISVILRKEHQSWSWGWMCPLSTPATCTLLFVLLACWNLAPMFQWWCNIRVVVSLQKREEGLWSQRSGRRVLKFSTSWVWSECTEKAEFHILHCITSQITS